MNTPSKTCPRNRFWPNGSTVRSGRRCLPCHHARSTTPTLSIRPNVPASGMT
nr:MAG TPA: Cytochrome c [Caudoviricetes sp.]